MIADSFVSDGLASPHPGSYALCLLTLFDVDLEYRTHSLDEVLKKTDLFRAFSLDCREFMALKQTRVCIVRVALAII